MCQVGEDVQGESRWHVALLLQTHSKVRIKFYKSESAKAATLSSIYAHRHRFQRGRGWVDGRNAGVGQHFSWLFIISSIFHISRMLEHLTPELQAKRLKEQAQLKKRLPRGACTLEDHKKFDYIRCLMREPGVFRFILPINHTYSPFVVVKRAENSPFPLYQLYYRPTHTFLLSAQEQKMNIGCNYLISSAERPGKDENFVAKVRGNFHRSEFSIYDNGANPDRGTGVPRRQFAFISIEETSMWHKKQQLTALVPKAIESTRSLSEVHKFQPIEFTCHSNNPNPILQDYRDKYNTVQSLTLKQLKTPKERSGPSLALQSSLRTQSLLLTRRSDSLFDLSIGSPLTIIQGFGLLLALLECRMI